MDREMKNKLGRFEEEVNSSVEKICSGIQAEIETYRAQEMGKQEDEILQQTYKMIQEEVNRIGTQRRKELSRQKMERKKKLYQQREEYTQTLFAQAQKSLEDFAASGEYKDYLMAKARKAAQNNELEGARLQVRPADMALEQELRQLVPIPVEAEESIHIGGVRLVNPQKSFVADETLDAALEQQKEWFAANSGFIVTM